MLLWERDMRFETRIGGPPLVDEHAARLVAGMVALLAGAVLLFDLPWLLAFLAYEFGARVFAGRRLSAMGQLAARVLAPALGLTPRWTPAPPKRFAQAIGLIVSSTSLVTWMLLGFAQLGQTLAAVLAVFAALEAAVGFCAGCLIFRQLMRLGWIPQEVCAECRVVPAVSPDRLGSQPQA